MNAAKQHCSVGLLCSVAVALASNAACTRKPEASRTETTSSDDFIERTRVVDDMFVHSEDNPAGWGADAAMAAPPRVDAGSAPSSQGKSRGMQRPSPGMEPHDEGARDPWDPPPVVPR